MKRRSVATTIISMFLAVSQIAGMGFGRGLRADVGTNETAGMQTGSGDSIVGLESVTPIAAPTGVKAEKPANSDTRVVISWDAVENAAGYQVWRATSSKDTYIALESVTATSRLCVGLTGGTTYYFKVRAYEELEGKKTYSDFSDDVIWIAPTPGEDTPDIGAPSGVAAEVSGSSVMLSWNAVSDVTGYQVWRADAASGRYYACGTVTTTSRRCPGLQVGSTYSFKVRAYKEENGTCVYGDFSSPVTVDILEISVPRNVKAVGKTDDSFELTWDKADSAEGYEIWMSATSDYDSYYKLIKNTTECSATIDKDVAGYRLEFQRNGYYLKVRAYGTVNGKKMYSDYVKLQAYTKTPEPLSGISVVRRYNSNGHPEEIVISFETRYVKADKCEIWVSASYDGTYELLTDQVSVNSVKYLSVEYIFRYYPEELGKAYYFKIRSSFAGSMSDFSKVVCIVPRPDPDIPQNIKVTRNPDNPDDVLVSWDAVPGTSKYEVRLRDDSAPENTYITLGPTTSTSFVIQNKYFRTPSSHSFSVRAYGFWDSSDQQHGKYSEPVSFNLADLPIPSMPIDEAHFPDENFRTFVQDVLDTGEKDGLLSVEERESVRVIDVKNMGISSLEGLDYFKNLEELDCSNNSLEELRSEKITKLKYLNCAKNHITSLSFNKSKALEVIDCSDNNLTYAPTYTSLKSLIAYNNDIHECNLIGNSALTQACETYGMELVDDGTHYICKDASTTYVYLDKSVIVIPRYFEPDIEGPTGVKIENPWNHVSKVRFSWNGYESDYRRSVYEYEVWRAEGATGKYYLCGAVTRGGSGKIDFYRDCPGLTKPGVTYYFKVRACWRVKYDKSQLDIPENYIKVYSNFSSAVGWTAPINETSAEIGVPANVRSEQIAETRAMVSWDAVSDITAYEVWRATEASGKYDLCGTVTDTRRECIGLGIGKTFYFKVRAYKAVDGGRVYSEFSSVINVKTEYEKVLPAPSGVNAVRKGYSIFTVLVIWKEVAGADGYQVWRANGDSSEFYALDSSTIHGTQRLCQGSWIRGETYKFKVRAYKIVDGKKHYGEFSSVVSAKIPE